MVVAIASRFAEGQDYDLYGPEVELTEMTCVVGERQTIGLTSDFAKREGGAIVIYWLPSDKITAQKGSRVDADISSRYVQRLTIKQKVRFEHYDRLLGRFGR